MMNIEEVYALGEWWTLSKPPCQFGTEKPLELFLDAIGQPNSPTCLVALEVEEYGGHQMVVAVQQIKAVRGKNLFDERN